MPINAIVFGGLSALAEIDALDHQALDAALQETGAPALSRETYTALLETPDGPERMARVTDGDAAPLHAAKQEHLLERIRLIGLSERPGVAEVIDAAEAEGVPLILVTDLSEAMLGDVFEAFQRIEPGTFTAIVRDWPAALLDLDAAPADCMAIAADPWAAAAARAAGLPVTAYPSAAHRGRDFKGASAATAALSPELLGLNRPI